MEETQQDSFQLHIFNSFHVEEGEILLSSCDCASLKISFRTFLTPYPKPMKRGGSVGRFHIPSSLSACIAGREKLQATAKGNLNK